MLDQSLLKELIDKYLKDFSTSNVNAGPLKQEVSSAVHSVLHKIINELNLVTREQFDIQAKVLDQTRQKLELLSNKILELENIKTNSRVS